MHWRAVSHSLQARTWAVKKILLVEEPTSASILESVSNLRKWAGGPGCHEASVGDHRFISVLESVLDHFQVLSFLISGPFSGHSFGKDL